MSYRQLSQSHTFINYHIDKSRPVVFWIEASNNEKHYYSLFYTCFIPKNGLYCNDNYKTNVSWTTLSFVKHKQFLFSQMIQTFY